MVKEYDYAKVGEVQQDGTSCLLMAVLDEEGVELTGVVEANAKEGWIIRLIKDPNSPNGFLRGETEIITERVEMKIRIIKK